MRSIARQTANFKVRTCCDFVMVWRLRFFFPWPKQPYQCHDLNVDRIALQRRLPEDDAWVTAHNLYLTVYCASSVNVLCFDPVRNCDQARTYASKYCSKPEKWFYMECDNNGLQHWLRCRTVGLAMVYNRLLEFRVVRSTRAVV